MNKEKTCQYLKDHGITFETTEHKAVFNMEELAEVKLPYPNGTPRTFSSGMARKGITTSSPSRVKSR